MAKSKQKTSAPDHDDMLILRFYDSLDEAQQRRFAALQAAQWGRGGAARVIRLTGTSVGRIRRGLAELRSKAPLFTSGRVRKPGGGRKRAEEATPRLVDALEDILAEATAGDPMKPLRWTSKSTRGIGAELSRRGFQASPMTVRRLLTSQGYTLQANQKVKEGGNHPDRDAQFRLINRTVEDFQGRGEPVISVDTKKKERVGEFKNGGRTWRPKGEPVEVNVYDFPDLGIGTAIPYGTYDVVKNKGMVNVGMSHDTAEFAVESIRQWWRRFGRREYPEAGRLLICADGGGSNGSRNRAWKLNLQALANETGMRISVCHYPPGTSKWNKIEHRMFSFISLNWRGQALVDYATVLNLIGTTKTTAGLRVTARLDPRTYDTGEKITLQQMAGVNMTPDGDLPAWNYTIAPSGVD